jgi:hypothetical protein
MIHASSILAARSGAAMAGDWSDEQNDAIVADYFAMFADDIAERPYNRTIIAIHRHDPLGKFASLIAKLWMGSTCDGERAHPVQREQVERRHRPGRRAVADHHAVRPQAVERRVGCGTEARVGIHDGQNAQLFARIELVVDKSPSPGHRWVQALPGGPRAA